MNYKAIIKKQSTIIAIAVICLTIATIGVSYALFFQVEANSKNQVVTAGTLDVSYGSGSSSIATTKLVPMSDDEALTGTSMTGTIYIENKGSLPATYEVAIGNDTNAMNTNKITEDNLLLHDYIRVAAYLNGEKLTLDSCESSEEGREAKLSCQSKSVNDENMYHLFDSSINVAGTGETTATVVIKVWIDEDAPEEIIGDYVYLKMDVTSEVDEDNADGSTLLTQSGTSQLALTASNGKELVNYKIYGNSIQSGTPTSTSTVEIESVGDKTVNLLNNNSIFSYNNIYFGVKKANSSISLEAGTYTFSVICDDGGVTNLYVLNADNDNSQITVKYKVTNITFTLTEKTNVILKAYDNRFTSINDIESFQLQNGENVTNHEPYGYKIPITITNGTKSKTTNIYLDEPLRKVGNYADYIDFKNKKIFRNVEVVDDTGALSIEESYVGVTDNVGVDIELPSVATVKGDATLTVDTTIQPSNIEVTYKS